MRNRRTRSGKGGDEMSAPERIWIAESHYWENPTFKRGKFEYVRADLVITETQPDPRDEVIKGLMEALEWCVDALERDYRGSATDCEIPQDIRAALAAAKAVIK